MTKTLFHRWFGTGRVPKTWRERLDGEGVVCEEEGIHLATTARHLKSPWRIALHKAEKKSGCSGALVVTGQRLVGFAGSRTAINIPWAHPSFGRLKIAVESPSVLLIEYSVKYFIEEASGSIELRFHLEDPAAFLTAIESARGAGPSG